ncbi:hypothetical protein KCG44_12740 [Pacificimonas sp. WHA3]|uniref:Uncharacterized protein n=1 Tax=Pacificimonas pallii TaxID=2827236 RepID=A0ABS6SGW7_9SPHN|nr:hypothetical protein [Pacificimonas pallii]MBV7257652.1 hypothetical protein [Pacificimonas pallii]
MDEKHEEVGKEDARGGETPGIGRYVLLISVVLVVVGMGVLLGFAG